MVLYEEIILFLWSFLKKLYYSRGGLRNLSNIPLTYFLISLQYLILNFFFSVIFKAHYFVRIRTIYFFFEITNLKT